MLTNHLRDGAIVTSDVVYQAPDDRHAPAALGVAAPPAAPRLRAGDAIAFDDRVLHRGGANVSDTDRDVAYFSFHTSVSRRAP